MSGSQVGVPELLDPPRLFAGRILCNEVAGGLVGFSAAGMAAVRPNALAAGPRPADEAGEWWTRLLIGEYFEVEYSDDNVESMALWPVSEGRWVVKSPGGGVLIENLDGSDPETGPAVSRPLRRRAGAFGPLYRFPSSEVWWSAVAGRHTLAGSDVLSMIGRDVKFGYRTAMIQVGSEWLVADRVKVADAPALVAPEATPAQLGIASGLDGGRRCEILAVWATLLVLCGSIGILMENYPKLGEKSAASVRRRSRMGTSKGSQPPPTCAQLWNGRAEILGGGSPVGFLKRWSIRRTASPRCFGHSRTPSTWPESWTRSTLGASRCSSWCAIALS